MPETIMGRKPRLVMPDYDAYVGDIPERQAARPPASSTHASGSPAEAIMKLFGLDPEIAGVHITPRIKLGKYYGVQLKAQF